MPRLELEVDERRDALRTEGVDHHDGDARGDTPQPGGTFAEQAGQTSRHVARHGVQCEPKHDQRDGERRRLRLGVLARAPAWTDR